MESSAQNSGTEGGVEAPRVLYTGARAVVSNAGQASRPVSGRPSASRPVSGRSARPVSGRATSSRPLSGKSTFYSGAEDLEQLRQRFVLLGGSPQAFPLTSTVFPACSFPPSPVLFPCFSSSLPLPSSAPFHSSRPLVPAPRAFSPISPFLHNRLPKPIKSGHAGEGENGAGEAVL